MEAEPLFDVLARMPSGQRLRLAAVLGLCPPRDERDAAVVPPAGGTVAFAGRSFELLPPDGQAALIAREISVAGGHSIANLLRKGRGADYPAVVRAVARHVGAKVPAGGPVPEAEEAVVRGVLKRMLDGSTPEQRANLAASLEAIAAEHGKSFGGQAGAAALLTAAQLSGFSLYVVASSLVGGITGVLGLSLPLSVYAGMSKGIAILIGPAGWSLLGLGLLYKLGAPNMRKALPAVLMVAAARAAPNNETSPSM